MVVRCHSIFIDANQLSNRHSRRTLSGNVLITRNERTSLKVKTFGRNWNMPKTWNVMTSTHISFNLWRYFSHDSLRFGFLYNIYYKERNVMVDFFNWLTFQNAYFHILCSIWFGCRRYYFNSSILSVISTFCRRKSEVYDNNSNALFVVIG